MERSTLKATTPLVSEKVAKVLTVKNTLYEKELSYVRKTLEREANYCKATIEKAKSNLIKSLEAKGSLHARRRTNAVCRERSVSLPQSVKSKRLDVLLHRSIPDQSQKVTSSEVFFVKDIDNTLSPVCSTSITLPEGPSTHALTYDDDDDPFAPKSTSTTETDDDVLATQWRAFDLHSLGESSLFNSPTSEAAEIPEILVTGVDNNNNHENTNNSETPQRKISLTRSYSTGDLPNTKVADKTQHAVACSSPVQIRRAGSTCNISGSLSQNCKEGKTTDGKPRHGSLDELFSQRLSNMLTDHNVPRKPKPRFQPYSEEPFYLRKKCTLRRCFDRKDLHKKGDTDGLVNNSNQERTEEMERPLASLLPPVALPSIYTQQNTKSKAIADEKKRHRDKRNGTRKSQQNTMLTVDVSSLTQNLTHCRYLRSNTQ